jgi:hypothetical protein
MYSGKTNGHLRGGLMAEVCRFNYSGVRKISPNIEEIVMVVLISNPVNNVLQVDVDGKLTKEDYQRLVPGVEDLIQRHGKIRMIVKMRDFHGWEIGAIWEDIKFDAKHFSDIERIALIGDKQWEKAMATFCKPFTLAKIRYFDMEQVDQAVNWIHQDESERKETG